MDEFDSRVGAPAHAYEEYYKAYSMAMLPGKERLNVSYGGKSECGDLRQRQFGNENANVSPASARQSSCLRLHWQDSVSSMCGESMRGFSRD